MRIPHLPPIKPWVFLLLMLMLLGAQIFLANKSWRSYQVLAGARTLGVAEAADLRAYTSVDELINRFGIESVELVNLLGVAKLPDAEVKVRLLADELQVDELVLIAQLQKLVPVSASEVEPTEASLYQQFESLLLEWMSDYGLIVLMLVVFLGSLGLPVPAGPLAALTGVLSFDGLMSGLPTALVILLAALVGDLLIFMLGCKTDSAKLVRYGRWLGYTEANRLRVLHLFQRWGGLTLLLTRSLVAHISAVASLLAGSAGIGVLAFALYSLVGRAAWLFIYFGLGYLVGSDFAMASSFLSYFSLLLVAALAMVLLVELLIKQRRNSQLADSEISKTI